MKYIRRATLTEGAIGSLLARLTLPMIFGVVSLVAFNLADTYFVGQLGTNELAAISFTFPVVFVLGSLAMGMGIGTSAVVSRAIGGGDRYKVQRYTTDSLSLAVLIVILFVAVGLFMIEPVFTLLGATPEIMPLIEQYMTIWFWGMPFIVIPMVGNNAIRATGDTTTPSLIMFVAAAVNIVLDPLLIFGLGPFPRLELAGAAIATVLARATTLAVSMWVLTYRERMITFTLPTLREGIASWKDILYIGLPAAGTNMIVPIGIGVVTGMLAVHGPAAVAGFGVASRIEVFALTMLMALGSVLAPFVGQNWGAGKLDRVRTGIGYSQGFSMVWGVLMFGLFMGLARPIAALFNDDPAVVSTIVTYLWIVPISYGLQGTLTLSSSALNVLNKPLHAAALNLTRMFGLYVPLGYAGSLLFGVTGIFGAIAIANAIVGVAAYLWLNRVLAAGSAAAAEPAVPAAALPKPAGADG